MSEQTAAKRNQRKTTIGTVVGAKMEKTRRVEVSWLAKYGKYGKYVRRRLVHFVHDEDNQSQEGDRVEIMETRPLSKSKRWRLVRIVAKASREESASLPAATAPVEGAEA